MANPTEGISPLPVGFDLCQSRDAQGGSNLTYSADFEGGGLEDVGGCGFNHTYQSSGVTVFDTRVCVTDSHGAQACETVQIKAYAGLVVTVRRDLGCTINATATVQPAGVRSLAAIDRMLFTARNGDNTATKEGSKAGGDAWTTGNWNLSSAFNSKTRVTATAFAGGVQGAESADARPGC